MIGRRTFVRATAAAISASVLPGRLFADDNFRYEYHRFTLASGRTLGYATYGDPTGWPVLYFHGIPTSRVEGRYFEHAAIENGCQLIAIDRPGFGLSNFQCGRRIVDWVEDVNEFINSKSLPDHIRLDQFSVASFSSGSAYSLVCAANIPPTRLQSVAIVDGVAPLEKIYGHGGYAEVGFRFAAKHPGLARIAFNLATRRIRRNPDKVLRKFSRFYAKPDARVFFGRRTSRIVVDSYLQCVRCGPAGVIHDMSLLARPWGFCLEDVDCKVSLWYGECDITTPVKSTANYLNSALKNSRLHVIRGEGHMSMLDCIGNAAFRQLKADRHAA